MIVVRRMRIERTEREISHHGAGKRREEKKQNTGDETRGRGDR